MITLTPVRRTGRNLLKVTCVAMVCAEKTVSVDHDVNLCVTDHSGVGYMNIQCRRLLNVRTGQLPIPMF